MTQLNRAQEKSTILPYAWVILAVVYFASVVAPFNQFKIPPIMPVLMESFQIDLIQAGLLMSIIAMIGLILALPAGMVLQRLGPKLSLLIALGLIAAGAALGALANSFGILLTSRVVEALGMGLMGVTAPTTIAMWFPPDQQGAPMGIWATWVPISSVAVYNLAPVVAASAGWQSIWWIGAAFALILMVLSGLLVRRPPVHERDDIQGSKVPDLRAAFSNRSIWLMALAFACFNLALVPLGIYYPTFLSQVRGYSLGQAAFISSLATLVILFSAPAAGWLSDKIGSRRLMFSIPFLFIAVSLLFPFHVTGWQIIALMILQGLVAGAVPTAIFATVSEIMQKPEWAGLGLALVLMGQNLGQLLGPIWFGQLVEGSSWALAGYLLIPFCLLGFISSWLVKVR